MERPDLAEELRRMADYDQAVRERLAETGELFNGYNAEMRAVHRRHGDRLAEIIDEVGRWPGRRLVGEQGSEAAFLIAQHDIANPPLMQRCQELYAIATDDGDADPRRLAYLEDRIRYFQGRRQRYGTQLGWNDKGEFGVWPPVDEPDRIGELRGRLGLPPLAEDVAAARRERPVQRPIDEVLKEHQEADDFARQTGWRLDDRQRG